jgi:hypothetical protein
VALLDRSQLDILQYARIGAINFSATGASSVVTTPITTVLSTAGDGGVSVPLQVFTTTAVGLVTTGADNLVLVAATASKKPIADAAGNEVYGRLTEATGVYTLTYYTLVAGVETAYTFASATNIDFYFVYQFDSDRMPRNAGVSISARMVQNDPAGVAASGFSKFEKLTVTALNTLSALTIAPSSTTAIKLEVNGKTENPFGGANAAFSVSGTAVTWSATNAKYSLKTTFDVVAFYS